MSEELVSVTANANTVSWCLNLGKRVFCCKDHEDQWKKQLSLQKEVIDRLEKALRSIVKSYCTGQWDQPLINDKTSIDEIIERFAK